MDRLPHDQFERDGLLAVPNFFDAATANALRAKAVRLAEEMDLTNHPRTVFVTRDDEVRSAGPTPPPPLDTALH